MLCAGGRCRISINLKIYEIVENDLIVLFSGSEAVILDIDGIGDAAE